MKRNGLKELKNIMILYQKDNFFLNIEIILKAIKQIPLYNTEEYNKKFNTKDTWPGFRSDHLQNTTPLLIELFFSRLPKLDQIQVQGTWGFFIHLRPSSSADKDWIHQDVAHDHSMLIYLNPTNLSSGTYLYDNNHNIINDIKYVQNRFVCFDSQHYHCAYGHHGNTLDDGRLTLNIFYNK